MQKRDTMFKVIYELNLAQTVEKNDCQKNNLPKLTNKSFKMY